MEVFILLQEDHGGWNDKMKSVRVINIMSRDLYVTYTCMYTLRAKDPNTE